MHVLIDYKAKCAISGLSFQYFNADEIRKLSVKEIVNPQALDRLLNPVANGLYDLALGPHDKNDICLTCGLDYFSCPGHFGHINLALPVYNPIFFKDLLKLFRSSCLTCHRLLTTNFEKDYFYARMMVASHGLVSEIGRVDDLYMELLNSNTSRVLSKISYRPTFEKLIEQILVENGMAPDQRPLRDACLSRNVVQAKLDILKDFTYNKLKMNRQLCPNCNMPLRQLKAEHNSKLFFAKGISNRALSKSRKSNDRSDSFFEDMALSENQLIELKEIDKLDIELDKSSSDEEDVEEEQKDEVSSSPVKAEPTNGHHQTDLSLEKLALEDQEMKKECEEQLINLAEQSYLTPIEARKHLKKLLKNEHEIICLLIGQPSDDLKDQSEFFFYESIVVPPSKYRPVSQFKEQRFENAQTAQFSKLLQQNIIIKDILKEIVAKNQKSIEDSTEAEVTAETLAASLEELAKKAKKNPSLQEKLQGTWLQMQTIVNTIYDSELDKINTDTPPGLKQLLEKKQGLFRKHMMGKRVNYAGRSVISPDVYIATDEIGIPEVFAKKLTYPQPVNSANYLEIRQLVLNGPDNYPGANLVEYGNGNIIRLRGRDAEGRMAIAKQLLTPETSMDSNLDIKIVHRHIKNGDVLLFNRQPTLHRNSIMAHKARVLPKEKTLRMHYSNCKAYNADFDGDEMNIHLLQNEIARSEALNIMLSSEHYLVPKDGTPLGGLIHDHVISGATLTMRDRFFDRADYQSLVYNCFYSVKSHLKLLPPAILKPRPLWTGKQVVTTLLLNLLPPEKPALNLEGKSKISEKYWYREHEPRKPMWSAGPYSSEQMSEAYVLIRHGYLLSGVLDKAHYGSSSYSLVHCCYELYGGSIAGQLLTSFGRLFTSFLQYKGFTLGVEDILLKPQVEKPMMKIVKKAKKCGYEVLAKVFNYPNPENKEFLTELYQRAHLNPDEAFMKEVDLAYKGTVDGFQNALTNICFPGGLVKQFPYNNLQLMIQSGAKGSTVNSMQMSCLLGQQELEGRRPRLMPNGNTLPSFQPYDPSPNSGGFISSSFMTGLTPQEYFFHCMAGREGLVDTAVKTSRSGYLQRCLIKHLEGIMVNYDLTVRDSDKSIIQFQYGEDGLAVDKTPFINDKQFPFLIDNSQIILPNKKEFKYVKEVCSNPSVDKTHKKVKDWKKECKSLPADKGEEGVGAMRWSSFINYSRHKSQEPDTQKLSFEERVQFVKDQWKQLSDEDKNLFKKSKYKTRLPVTAEYNPSRYMGAISEKLQECIETYTAKYHAKFVDDTNYAQLRSSQVFHLDSDQFKELIYYKSLRSCITPGDCVGILAAQSIGEPSTQMTLNTFHFAGRGDMNVTLGIPRLREILMVASANIKTPSMQVPVFDHQLGEAEKLKARFTRTLLWDCLNRIDVEQTLHMNYEEARNRVWLTKMRIKLLPAKQIKEKTSSSLKLHEIIYFIESKFIKNLCIAINKKYNQISSSGLLHASTVRDKNMKNFRNINLNRMGNEQGEEVDEEDNDVTDEAIQGGDSMGEELMNKIDDELEYVGEEQEEDEIKGANGADDDSYDSDDSASAPRGLAKDEPKEAAPDRAEELEEQLKLSKMKKKCKKPDEKRINGVLKTSSMLADYSYDAENLRWVEVTFQLDALKPRLDLYSIAQKEAKHAYIAKVEGIKRCFLNQSTLPEDKGCHKLITEGININEIIKNSHILNVSKLYLNDIHRMGATFGIEAAAKVIINEIKMVFGAYGIHVDYRHLSLIADYMTFEGSFKPFNRIGIRSNPSPLQKMSFETCLQFFKDACLYGQHESMESPSARIVTGRMVQTGTGIFDVLTKIA